MSMWKGEIFKRQGYLIVALMLLAVALAAANLFIPKRGATLSSSTSLDLRNGADLDSVIETTLERFGVAPDAGRKSKIRQANNVDVRREIRFTVTASFPSVLVNHALNLRLRPLRARVIGTEDTKERKVTLHIQRNNMVVRSLVFVELD